MQPTKSQFVAWGYRVLFGLLCLLIASLAVAQTPEPAPPGPPPVANRPHLDPFPAEQDWSFLADPPARTIVWIDASICPGELTRSIMPRSVSNIERSTNISITGCLERARRITTAV